MLEPLIGIIKKMQNENQSNTSWFDEIIGQEVLPPVLSKYKFIYVLYQR